MLLASPCAPHDHGRRNSKLMGSCPGQGCGVREVSTQGPDGGKVPAVQGEAPARINQQVPSQTRSLGKLPERPGTPLHPSPTIRETVPHGLCSAHVTSDSLETSPPGPDSEPKFGPGLGGAGPAARSESGSGALYLPEGWSRSGHQSTRSHRLGQICPQY